MVDCRNLLEANLVRFGTKKALADYIGVSRSAISAYMNDCYVGSTGALEKRIIQAFAGHVLCPHVQREITRDQCNSYFNRAMPQSSAAAHRHWRACQACPHASARGIAHA